MHVEDLRRALMVRLRMPGTRIRFDRNTTAYEVERVYLDLETPRLYGQSAQCLAEAAQYWGIIAGNEEHDFDQEAHSKNAAEAWDKATEGMTYMAMARQCHRYWREHREDVSVPPGMRVYTRALFQKMVASMVRRRVPVPTRQDASVLCGMARNLAEQAHAVALLLPGGRNVVQPLPAAE